MIKLVVRKLRNLLRIQPRRSMRASARRSIFPTEAQDANYRLTASASQFKSKMEKADDIIRRYRNALRKLAE